MSLKTLNGLAVASVKTFNWLAIASVKTINWIDIAPPTTYATRNPSDKSADISLSGNNLIATATTTARKSVRGNIGKSSWKRYWEVTVWATGTDFMIWIWTSSWSLSNYCWFDAGWRSYYSNASSPWAYHNNSWAPAAYGTQYWAGAVIGVALDMDGWTISFYKDWVSQWTAFSWVTGTIYPMVSPYANWASYTANFGASAFVYSPPWGYNSGLYT